MEVAVAALREPRMYRSKTGPTKIASSTEATGGLKPEIISALAGSVAILTPNPETIADLLLRFARPVHPEKSLEELERLLERIRSHPVTRVDSPTRSHRIKQRLSDEDLGEIVRRYVAGDSTPLLAREFGISEGSINRLLRSRGVELRLRRLSEQTVAHTIESYESGLGVQAVADQLDVPKSTLLRALKRAGVQMRAPKC